MSVVPSVRPEAVGNHRECPFCRLVDAGTEEVQDYGTMVAFMDAYPVTPRHYLIIPKRHVADYFELRESEILDSNRALHDLRDRILHADETVQGFNIGANCGTVAGQTVLHAHIHLIPRRQGDMQDPRGGVRGVIPEKMKY
ncbi:HIT family protein [Streptomyces sp900129855]|uniref:HIT family protein n=1 Tax=Streptomyces sp. 900129855 TaxID=3155129 RepID=A0ABV2ZLD5_9ACTN